MTTYPVLLETGSDNWLFEDGQEIWWRYSGDFAWSFVVDWDNDGMYEDRDEANRLVSVFVSRGRNYKFQSDGRGYEYPRVGRATITLDNYDRRYDPYNSGSPLYGNLLPGRRFKLIAIDQLNGISYDVIHGFLDDIKPISGNNYVIIDCKDDLALFQDYDYEADLYEDKDVDDLILQILTDIGWIADGKSHSIDSSPLDVVSYWWCSDKSALKALEELCDAVLALFFIARDGTFKFYNRQHTHSSGTTLSQDELKKTIQLLQPWETVKNYIRVKSYPRSQLGSIQVLWTLVDTPYLSPGQTIEFWAENIYNAECVPASYVTLTKTTDYTANAEAGGGGADMTDDLTVVDTQFATTRKISITNDAADMAYLTLLQSRGYPITSQPTTIIQENATSQAKYGTKKFILNNEWLQDSNRADDLATFLQGSLADPEFFPEVILEGRNDIQFGMDLFDQETLDISELGISGDYMIGNIEHRWSAGSGVETTIKFEAVSSYSDDYWIFPAKVGVSSVFGY